VLGGYIAGRLRTRWLNLDADEVAFRDTAHGFLAWSVATLFTAWLVSSSLTSLVSGGVQAGAKVAGGAASGATNVAAQGGKSEGGPMAYSIDSLFRSAKPRTGSAAASPEESTAEVTRIFTHDLAAGELPQDDARYVAQVVSQRAGISQQEAEKRVNDTFAKLKDAETKAKEAADAARKASAAAALLLFISLLIGAFLASLMAVYGGRRRDAIS
jgi:hypothetical protein